MIIIQIAIYWPYKGEAVMSTNGACPIIIRQAIRRKCEIGRLYDTGHAAADGTMVLQGVYDKVQLADSEPTCG